MLLRAVAHVLAQPESVVAGATICECLVVIAGRKTRRCFAGVIVGICAAIAIWAPDPDRYQRSLVSFHDFLHFPGFAFVVGVLLVGFAEAPEVSRRGRIQRLLGICFVAIAVGVGVELVQAMVGGFGDPWDVLFDGGGIVAAAVLAASQWRDIPTSTRWLLRSVALAIALGFLMPTFVALVDEARARKQFPVLADFGARSELTRFTWSAWSSAVLEQADRMDGSHQALRLSLSPGKYPGLSFEFFPRDWRGWRQFVLVCANPGKEPLPLTIRINDIEHNQEYEDRYNRTFTLAPGANEIRMLLSDVESAPRTRKLDLARVELVVAFVYDLREPRELLLHEIRLTR
jgi:hypothetical protein